MVFWQPRLAWNLIECVHESQRSAWMFANQTYRCSHSCVSQLLFAHGTVTYQHGTVGPRLGTVTHQHGVCVANCAVLCRGPGDFLGKKQSGRDGLSYLKAAKLPEDRQLLEQARAAARVWSGAIWLAQGFAGSSEGQKLA